MSDICRDFGIIGEVSRNCGEKVYITITYTPKRRLDRAPITSAIWELFNENWDCVMKGKCKIDGREMSVLLKTSTPGSFKLKFTFKVPPETRIAGVDVFVN